MPFLAVFAYGYFVAGWSLAAVEIAGKFVGVYGFARKYLPKEAAYTALLMSTGLTFGTILVTVVIATAVIPTVIAQRFFQPALPQVGGTVDMSYCPVC